MFHLLSCQRAKMYTPECIACIGTDLLTSFLSYFTLRHKLSFAMRCNTKAQQDIEIEVTLCNKASHLSNQLPEEE